MAATRHAFRTPLLLRFDFKCGGGDVRAQERWQQPRGSKAPKTICSPTFWGEGGPAEGGPVAKDPDIICPDPNANSKLTWGSGKEGKTADWFKAKALRRWRRVRSTKAERRGCEGQCLPIRHCLLLALSSALLRSCALRLPTYDVKFVPEEVYGFSCNLSLNRVSVCTGKGGLGKCDMSFLCEV
eukprot:6172343-Pleurochrysis_carterae.AAC.1